jgi:hypothetical protein
MKKLLVSLVILVFSFSAFGQFSTGNKWSYSVFVGGSNLMSDLGGSNAVKRIGIQDLDLQASRAAFGLGLQRHYRRLTISTNVMATQLVARDEFTKLASRSNRNLSVRTDLIEANFLVEVLPFKSTKSPFLNKIYVNSGLGLMHFEPKASYQDDWIKLRPLGTEGQNYLANSSPYKSIGAFIPFGFGYKFGLNRYTTAKLDFGFRKTFTDYLDDVSTTYANSAAIAGRGGEISPILADRSVAGFNEGERRGNSKNKDLYFTIGVKIERSIGRKRSEDCGQFDIPRKPVNIEKYD